MTSPFATADVVVVGDGPHPGPDAVAVAREIAHRLDGERAGRVVLLAHTPDLTHTHDTGVAHPLPSHWVGPLLRTWAERGLDWTQMQAELAAVRGQVDAAFGAGSLRSAAVAVVSGRVRMLDRGRLSVDLADPAGGEVQTHLLEPRRVVLATGAAPTVPSVSGIGQTRLHVADSVLDLPRRPDSVVVFGGGAHGCEIAQGLARLGSTVTLIESGPRPLADLPDDAAQVVVDALRDDGVRMITRARLASIAPTLDGGAWVGIDPGGDVAAEAFVLATGRRARYAGLDLAAAGVEVGASGQVVVDDRLRAGSGAVFACGEVTGLMVYGAGPGPMARVVAANVAAGDRRGGGVGYEMPIPARITRTDPEVAVVGQVDVPDDAICGVGEGPGEGTSVQLVVAPAGGGARRSLLGRGGHGGRVLIGAVLVGAGASEAAGQLVLAATAGLPAATLIDIDAPDGTWAAAVQTCMARTLADGGRLNRRPA